MLEKATSALSLESREAPPQRHPNELLTKLYEQILTPRLIEERMLLLLRQGRISKWFSGIGQEAIAVGSTAALIKDEYILPLHRNLGVFTTRDVPLDKLFLQFQGREGGFTKGRDRSFHFGAKEHHIVGMISHLGPQMAVADGIALAHKLKKIKRCALVFCGDGGTSQGDFHEAINVAAVWELPVIFLIENNGYGLSTPVTEQYRCTDLVDRGAGYGIEAHLVDGNDLLAVYDLVKASAEVIRERPRPVLIECKTFRMRGHEEASGVKYVPPELLKEWAARDPIQQFESALLRWGVVNELDIARTRREVNARIEAAIEVAFSAPPVEPDSRTELNEVYMLGEGSNHLPPSGSKRKRRYVDAVSDGLRQAMERYPNLVLMGQDIAEYGGVFKVTEGFLRQFGRERVRNTPLCESAIIGAALGLSIEGIKSVVEMQFADFVSSGFTQVVNNLAKVHYRWGQNADVVIRLPCGAGVAAGPFHSQSNEIWFIHTPGLKVVYPAFPHDAKGLLLSAIADPNPVMFFEHKALYRSVEQEIPEEPYYEPLGKGRVVMEGDDATIVTYGAGVHWAISYLEQHKQLSVEVVDLRTLVPLDKEIIIKSVEKTGRLLVLHEDTLTAGFGAEISAIAARECFQYLDAPVFRVASLDTPVPFAPELEQNFLAKSRLAGELEALLAY
ncbi:MAG: dehydrogenase E1 component subunit alpha/beta [Deltaproteobacteria bacterium]|nr:dehydrogenase E1 component subunit alpha/beta [Deltaproteobacteria bacterium]